MSITESAIRQNRVTFFLLGLIVVAGLSSYFALPKNEDPGYVVRVAQVITLFPGASPERVENLVTDKIEEVVQEIPELDFVESTSSTGVSEVYVNIKDSYTDMRPIWDDLRRKIDSVRGSLPQEVRGPFVNDDFGDVYGTMITVTGEGFSYREMEDMAEEIRDELLRIEEVAKVTIVGTLEERVFIEYSNTRLAELGLSPAQLQRILSSSNIIIPGGSLETPDERITLEPSGNFETLDDVRRTVIELPGTGQVLFLEDVASIRRGYVDPVTKRVYSSGEAALTLAISLREGGNILVLGEEVRELYNRLEGFYPFGIEFDIVAFQADVVNKKVNEFAGNLGQSIGIVILVMVLTLGLRTGLVVATLIPMTVLMTFPLMSVFDIGVDQISLAALIIALGMLVDNAIVMSESILSQINEGKPPLQAAIDSASELRISLLTSSLTTSAAFLPIYLAESATGEYTAALFQVVTIALLSSWTLALTMTPLLCYLFLGKSDQGEEETSPSGDGLGPFDTGMYQAYRGILVFVLRFPALGIVTVVGLFALAMYGMGFVPNIFFPAGDKPLFSIELEYPRGTQFQKTDAMVSEINAFLKENYQRTEEEIAAGEQGIINWASFVGRSAPKFVLQYSPSADREEYAYLLVNVTDIEFFYSVREDIEAFIFERYPDVSYTVKTFQNGPAIDKPIEIRISGSDTDTLFSIVDEVKASLAQTPGITQVGDNWGMRSKKLVVDIDQPRVRRAGLSNQDVAVSLQTMMEGIQVTEFREGNTIIPVELRAKSARRQDPGKIDTTNIFSSASQRSVPLRQVADTRLQWEASSILRRNGLRTVTIEADVLPGFFAMVLFEEIRPWLVEQSADWPFGYRWEFGGEFDASSKANESIAVKLPIGLFIIVSLLIVQFNSFRRASIVLVTIPLGLIGVTAGLLLLKSVFGFMTLLGVISLAGIVINNAIVLLERINLEIDENGLEPPFAVVVAAQRRMWPILLTTMTTVGGLIPLYLGGGAMWEPMAVAIIFGLLFSTMLTLGFIPLMYSLLFRVSYRGFSYQEARQAAAE